jgi:hypothetical protein
MNLVMASQKPCPACQRPNDDLATRCVHCGEPLVALLPSHITTPIESTRIAHLTQSSSAEELSRRSAGMFVFQILGHDQPLITHIHPRITVGRFGVGEPPPTVDLGPYSGSTLGVSRQHAVIATSSKGYTLQDLNSTNGTWVNDHKLESNETVSLASGDLIHFGQLACYAYFQSPTRTATLASSFTMSDASGAAFNLTPRTLLSMVSPFVMALSGLQSVHNDAQRQPASEIQVVSLQYDSAKSQIRVVMNNAQDAVRIVLGSISRWRLTYNNHLQQIWGKQSAGTAPLSGERITAMPTHLIDRVREELTAAELRLAQDICADMLPDRTDDERRQYMVQLRSHLHILATSPIALNP